MSHSPWRSDEAIQTKLLIAFVWIASLPLAMTALFHGGRSAAVAVLGIARARQLPALGEALMLGASPGLICSGVASGIAVSTVRDSGIVCSVVVAGMHPGLAGGPIRISESLVATAATARRGQDRWSPPAASSSIVTVAVRPETSGTPGGT
jgi:hypothetical protein